MWAKDALKIHKLKVWTRKYLLEKGEENAC